MKIAVLKCVVVFGLLALLSSACKKEEKRITFSEQTEGMWDCHVSQNWDSVKIANALQGSWELIAAYSFSSGESPVSDRVVVNFLPNGSLTFFSRGKSSVHGWKVVEADSALWEIEVTPEPDLYLSGRIQLCGDKLLFFESYRDLLDHLYQRRP